MELNFWNITYVMMLVLSLGVYLAKHGENKNGKYNFWVGLLSTFINLFILYKGGFFN